MAEEKKDYNEIDYENDSIMVQKAKTEAKNKEDYCNIIDFEKDDLAVQKAKIEANKKDLEKLKKEKEDK